MTLHHWLYAQGRFNYDRGTNFREWYALNGTGANTVIATTTPTVTYRGNYNISQTTNDRYKCGLPGWWQQTVWKIFC